MSDKKLLKNCPFCGGKATIEHDYDFASHPWYYVECDECGCKTESYVDENGKLKAIESWNTRVPMESIVKELELKQEKSCKLYAIAFDPEDRGSYDAYSDAIEIVKEEGGLNDCF